MTSILGTQSIQHPNGTAAASIDSGGRITKPANPAFAAYSNLSNVAMSSLANGTHHLNYFGVEYFDVGGHYNTSTSTFTVPVTGVYRFFVQLQINGGGTSDNSWGINLHFQVNSAGNHANGYDSLSRNDGSTADYKLFTKEALLSLSATNTVRVAMSVNANANVGTIETTTNDGRCRFEGYLIG